MPARAATVLAACAALVAVCVLAGCSSAPALTSDEEKVCLAAAEEDWATVHEDLPLIDNAAIRRQAERLGAEVRSLTRKDAMASIVRVCVEAGWRDVVAEAKASERAVTQASQAALAARRPGPLRTATLPAPACNGPSRYAPTSFMQTTLDLDTGTATTSQVAASAGSDGTNRSTESPAPSPRPKRWAEYYIADCTADRIALASNVIRFPREVQRQPASLAECEKTARGGAVQPGRAGLAIESLVGKRFCEVREPGEGLEKMGVYFTVRAEGGPQDGAYAITIEYALY
ncbi:hypothetical protein [Nonomuraea sp. NPDC050691]|uniref:hypothetical protein n=1 Tax=Nonomuraea sp. NPDC050691 TaxID=3155661 RepID=UPI0033CA4F13